MQSIANIHLFQQRVEQKNNLSCKRQCDIYTVCCRCHIVFLLSDAPFYRCRMAVRMMRKVLLCPVFLDGKVTSSN